MILYRQISQWSKPIRASLDRGQAAAAAYLHLASPAQRVTARTHNKPRAALRRLPARGRILAGLEFIFIPAGILTGK